MAVLPAGMRSGNSPSCITAPGSGKAMVCVRWMLVLNTIQVQVFLFEPCLIKHRAATLRSTTPCRLWVLERREFRQLLANAESSHSAQVQVQVLVLLGRRGDKRKECRTFALARAWLVLQTFGTSRHTHGLTQARLPPAPTFPLPLSHLLTQSLQAVRVSEAHPNPSAASQARLV